MEYFLQINPDFDDSGAEMLDQVQEGEEIRTGVAMDYVLIGPWLANRCGRKNTPVPAPDVDDNAFETPPCR